MFPTTFPNNSDSLKRAAEGTLDENVHKRIRTDASSQKVDEFVKSIDFSFLFPSKCTFSFDLNKIESQTNKTYKTLIEEQSAFQTPYIISFVNDEKDDNLYDLDAKSSVIALQENTTHPATKNKIRSVYLFTIGSLTEEFKYLGILKRNKRTGNIKQPFLQAVNKALSGDPEGFYELALNKLKPTKKSTEKNIAEAIELLMIAAKGKSTNAFKKLEKLAKEGNTQAEQNLAICHQYGFDTEVNQQAAISITDKTFSYRNEAINPSSQKVNEFIKNIDLSFLYPSKCTLLFDLNKIEPLTNKTYKTLIEEQRLTEHQTPYIISLVNDAGDDSFYDLDGRSILPMILGNTTHPLTNNKIRAVYLFTIDSLSEEFKYFGAFKRYDMQSSRARAFLEAVTKYASGDPKGLYELAIIKTSKKSTEKDIAEAIELLMLAAKEMSKNAFILLEDLANRGNTKAALYVAICHQYGYGTEVDLPKALNLFTLLAKENDTEAFHNILASASRGDRITQTAIDFCFEKENDQRKSTNSNPISVLEHNLQSNMNKAMQGNSQAFKALLELADNGIADAEYCVGTCEHYGYGTPLSIENAIKWYAKSARQKKITAFNSLMMLSQQGYASAQNEVAYCKIQGLGTPRDLKGGWSLYSQSANKGNAEGQYNAGNCLEKGIGTQLDIEKATEWYTKSAALDHPGAVEALSRLIKSGSRQEQKNSQPSKKENAHLRSTNHPATIARNDDMNKIVEAHFDKALQGDGKGFFDLNNLAMNNNAHAQYFFGLCLQNGYCSTASPEKAIQWYGKAAKQGHSEAFDLLLGFAQKDFATAQNEVAFCKSEGLVTPLDLKGAYSLILQSATSGNAIGQYTLGCSLEKGIGTEANIDEALLWYLKSAKAGERAAFEALGRLAGKGNIKALEYWKYFKNNVYSPEIFRKLSEDNQPNIIDQIDLYGRIGNPANYGPLKIYELEMNKAIQGDKDAFKVLLNSAEKGNPRAQFYVGICYERGYGTAFSLENAMQWCAKSAESEHRDGLKHLLVFANQGYAFAQNKAAHCKFHGLGSTVDRTEACRLYALSADNGNAEGQYYYGYCLEEGIGIEFYHNEAIVWYANAANQNHPEAFKALSRCAEKGNVKAQNFLQQIKQNFSCHYTK